jgi:hypothetical protein
MKRRRAMGFGDVTVWIGKSLLFLLSWGKGRLRSLNKSDSGELNQSETHSPPTKKVALKLATSNTHTTTLENPNTLNTFHHSPQSFQFFSQKVCVYWFQKPISGFHERWGFVLHVFWDTKNPIFEIW